MIRKTLKRWAAFSRTRQELEQCNDHRLADMGIVRGDIDRLAREHSRRF